MERSSTEMVFKWFEEVWAQGPEDVSTPRPDASLAISGGGACVPISPEEFRRAHRSLNEGLADIHAGLEFFASDGDRVTCAMAVKARNKVSGEPVAFRSCFDGKLRDGRLVSTTKAIDYLLAE